MAQSRYRCVEISSLYEVNAARAAASTDDDDDDRAISFKVTRAVSAETYVAITSDISTKNESSRRGDFIKNPRKPPYEPPPIITTRNYEQFKNAFKTHGTYMEMEIPGDVSPFIRERLTMYAEMNEVEIFDNEEEGA